MRRRYGKWSGEMECRAWRLCLGRRDEEGSPINVPAAFSNTVTFSCLPIPESLSVQITRYYQLLAGNYCLSSAPVSGPLPWCVLANSYSMKKNYFWGHAFLWHDCQSLCWSSSVPFMSLAALKNSGKMWTKALKSFPHPVYERTLPVHFPSKPAPKMAQSIL